MINPTDKEATAEQSFDQGLMGDSGADSTGDERAAGEEIELALNS